MGDVGLGWLRWALEAEWLQVEPAHPALVQEAMPVPYGVGQGQKRWVSLVWPLPVGWLVQGLVDRSIPGPSCVALTP